MTPSMVSFGQSPFHSKFAMCAAKISQQSLKRGLGIELQISLPTVT
jgi:hypothetical protein